MFFAIKLPIPTATMTAIVLITTVTMVTLLSVPLHPTAATVKTRVSHTRTVHTHIVTMDIRCAYREKIISKHATVKQPALTKQTVPISIVTTLIQRYVDTTASVPVDRTVPVITLVLEAGIVHMEEAQFILPITEMFASVKVGYIYR